VLEEVGYQGADEYRKWDEFYYPAYEQGNFTGSTTRSPTSPTFLKTLVPPVNGVKHRPPRTRSMLVSAMSP